mmetsp:Transcript_36972/g.66517  ORF Transcript_36972/g.66517 Transcript_36972/m.66517 type:complete len:150 (-) Transcript_36972:161-610(-)|eukprot:CAMPEP_0201870954 /NCGR_PEP_ID=MMETSP0902-20130614/3969_1 /ASSEMBLY_ACC=CAM_ASM_000551 /TAXON_ID=420261 /ORGANISM="Thalassiosira antarctica, Strain CCMP982" /LENGTH=149 /DNA_ID=CAMNT_0048396769 /DNA_START=90 /DNA_END=539 /DNA_ORIENTATION=+
MTKWNCVNTRKNSPITILFECGWSGECFPAPSTPSSNDDGDSNSTLLGSATLKTAIAHVKPKIPALYLMDQNSAHTMTCGKNTVCGDEWETTMLCHFIYDDNGEEDVPVAVLDDGREAVVITLGDGSGIPSRGKASVVTRCLGKGGTYG